MPDIDATAHEYRVTIREGVRVTLNAYVLMNCPEGVSLAKTHSEEKVKQLVARMRKLTTIDPPDSVVDDAELLAAYDLVMKEWSRLGNSAGPQPAALRSTADFPNAAPSVA